MNIIKNCIFSLYDDKDEYINKKFKCFHADVMFNHAGLYIHYILNEDFYWLFTLGEFTYSGKSMDELYLLINLITLSLIKYKENKDLYLVVYCWNLHEIKEFFVNHINKKCKSEVIINNTILLRDASKLLAVSSLEDFVVDYMKKDILTMPSVVLADFSDEVYNEYTIERKGVSKIFKTCAAMAKDYIKQKLPDYQSSYITKRIPFLENYKFIRYNVFRASLCFNNDPNKIYEHIYSWDQSSAHAHKLICKKFPISRPVKAAMNKSIEWYFENKWCWFKATIYNVIPKEGFESINPFKIKYDNKIELYLDLPLLEAFNLCYNYSKIEYSDLIISNKDYVQDELRCAIADMYIEKAEYKVKDAHRNKLKVRLNSGSYGIAVERLWEIDDKIKEKDFKICNSKWYNLFENRLILPQVGVSITSYVFLDEIKILASDPEHCAYGDTDSIKGNFTHNIVTSINKRNEECEKEVKEFCNKYNYDFELMKNLGKYVPDATYRLFKAIAPKEYIYLTIDGKLGATTAGYAKHYNIKDIPKDCHYKFEENKYIQAILYEPISQRLDPFKYFKPSQHYKDYIWCWDPKLKVRYKSYHNLTVDENARLTNIYKENYKKVTQ